MSNRRAAMTLEQGSESLQSDIEQQLESVQRLFQQETEAELPSLLRAWTVSHRQNADIEAVLDAAERLRAEYKALATVGIGGSDLSARVYHETLNPPYFNMRPNVRGAAPEAYFAGDTFDPMRLNALLDSLEERSLLEKTCVNVISKSGRTGETIAALMIIRERLKARAGSRWSRQIAATTGLNEDSELYRMSRKHAFLTPDPLPIREGVGGRFSAFSPVGLLFLAAASPEGVSPRERVHELLAGVESAHRRFHLPSGDPDNIAYRLAGWLHQQERNEGRTALVFYHYADNQRLGEWFTQLYSESLQERGEGLDVLPARGPTSNHSMLNGILNGPRNKAVLFLHWSDLGNDLRIPTETGVSGDMKAFEGLSMSQAQTASYQGTAADLLEKGLPYRTLQAPVRDARCLGELMRILMDVVAVKGRLQDLHLNDKGELNLRAEETYLQSAVEGYKKRTREYAEAQRSRS
ncbi:MAG: hypothetical protein OXT69_02285 [Candidatus Poribacteria bacterium]|nr:hypothetical protein [Candidatus Poribacteria bacterium]